MAGEAAIADLAARHSAAATEVDADGEFLAAAVGSLTVFSDTERCGDGGCDVGWCVEWGKM